MLKGKDQKRLRAQAGTEGNKPGGKKTSRQEAVKQSQKPNPADVTDEVDEAGWESFPASDPPSYSPSKPEP